MPKLLLLDGNSLAYRAFFALPETLSTPDGQPTNSVYGFTNMLLRMLREREPDYVAVAFDTKVPAFRLEKAPEYKAQREETPSPLRSQFPLVREVLDALCVPVLTADEAEADDIIATLAEAAVEAGISVEIVTGDRDMFQCVTDPDVMVIYTRRGISEVDEMDEAAVEARYGVSPNRYVELAAMRGDNSDNLAGVPGIGDKTAAKLLDKYGSLDAIIEHVDELTPKQSENVASHWQQVERNVEVMSLRKDIDVGVDVNDLEIGEWDVDRIRALYAALDFGAVLDRTLEFVDRYAPEGTVVEASEGLGEADIDLVAVADADGVAPALDGLGASIGIAADFGAHPGDPPTAWAVSDVEGVAAWAPARNAGADELTAAITRAGRSFSTHDAKNLIRAVGTDKLDEGALDIDVEIAGFLLDPGAGSFTLEDIAERILAIELTSPDRPQDELALGGGDGDDEYLARRAWVSAALAEPLRERLDSTGQWDLYERAERPLIRILAEMEDVGIRVDVHYLEDLSTSLTGRIETLQHQIWDHAGREFVVNSPKQLAEVLFDELGLPPQKKTKTGFSTDAATLEALHDEHPIAEAILEYRNLEKLRGTYTDALPPLVDRRDGRLHTRFKQTGASTGRLSSENPNLMNIPVRSEEGRRIRRAFVADDGFVLCAADYSQIELRVMAHLSGDPGLIEAFASHADIHTATASKVFGVPPDELERVHRDRAKVVNYGLLYGMQTWGLASRMGLETAEAQEIIDAYFAQFATLRKFMDTTIEDAKEHGYTTTLLGRRRWFPELRSRNPRLRQVGERQALNAPIQGSAADIMKLAMIDVDRDLAASGLGARLLLQVHDELVLEVPESEVADVTKIVVDAMENTVELAVPLVVDASTGASWADVKG